MFTPLHQALGIPSRNLAWDDIQAICGQAVKERDDLDFKRSIPIQGSREAKTEIAKDLAAMANSGGGVLVIGIDETRGAGTAGAINPFALDEKQENELFRIAYSMIHPPLTDLGIERIHNPEDPEQTVVLVNVGDSLDMPHLIMANQNHFVAPCRQGATTVQMSERTLEAAYRQRFAGRLQQRQELDDLYAEQIDALDTVMGVWLVVAARPERPARFSHRYVGGEGQSVIQRAQNARRKLMRTDRAGLLDRHVGNPHPGYRRWIWKHPETEMEGLGSGNRAQHIEVHFDGCVTAAVQVAGRDRTMPNLSHVHVPSLETALTDVLALIWATRTRIGLRGNYVIKAGLQPDINKVLQPYDFEPGTTLLNQAGRPLRKVRPIIQEADTDTLADVAEANHDLVTDFLQQLGIGFAQNTRTREECETGIRLDA